MSNSSNCFRCDKDLNVVIDDLDSVLLSHKLSNLEVVYVLELLKQAVVLREFEVNKSE